MFIGEEFIKYIISKSIELGIGNQQTGFVVPCSIVLLWIDF